ncbi:MAG: cation:proton antiporter, partial [Deltaproteobacteria bacterium]|nr:cation:proton antiporter [Deltaproteobacteria bacterium]
IASVLVKTLFMRIGISPIVGYLALGFLIHVSHRMWDVLFSETVRLFEILALFGIICLLFRVGIESNIKGLWAQLRSASLLWFSNIIFSGALGFGVTYHLLHLPLVPSLFVGTALTATSISVPVAVWDETGAMRTPTGELLLDVAEMDDISGVVLMALILTIAPVLEMGNGADLVGPLAKNMVWFFVKAMGFGAFCFLFSCYAEKPITDFFRRTEEAPAPMLMVAAVGFLIASLAELLGFSLAIGAFFAGLTFSRNPDTVKMEPSFAAIYDFFTPFFFIGVGLTIDPNMLVDSAYLGLLVLGAAVVGKMLGTMLPALYKRGVLTATVLGISMVPRAEIAMVIMKRGRELGEWAVPSSHFSVPLCWLQRQRVFLPPCHCAHS